MNNLTLINRIRSRLTTAHRAALKAYDELGDLKFLESGYKSSAREFRERLDECLRGLSTLDLDLEVFAVNEVGHDQKMVLPTDSADAAA